MTELLSDSYLVDSLRVAPSEQLRYDGVALLGGDGVAFGGQMAAQALIVSAQTIEDARWPHSINSLFLSAVVPGKLVSHRVDVLKEGKAFSVFRIETWQGDRLRITSLASFHHSETSPEHQIVMPFALAPKQCPVSSYIPPGTNPDVRTCFEIREVDVVDANHQRAAHPQQAYWVKAKSDLGLRQAIHSAALVWFADLSMPWTTDIPYADLPDLRVGASLNHSVWFHRPFRADEWLLFVQESVVYVGARALTRGLFFRESGELVASAAQETLLRRLPAALDSKER